MENRSWLYRVWSVVSLCFVFAAGASAYDDIYGSSDEGTSVRSSRRKQKAQAEQTQTAQSGGVLLKSKNLVKYNASGNTVMVLDTTVKGSDYYLDTVQVMGSDGEVEKTLILKTKERQDVAVVDGTIVVGGSSAGVSDDALVAVSDDDYTYTKRLNKYHGTDYDVVGGDSESEVVDNSGNTTTVVLATTPYYYSWDPFWDDPWYRPYYYGYNWRWGYDPYWVYRPYPYHYGGFACHRGPHFADPHHGPAPVHHPSRLKDDRHQTRYLGSAGRSSGYRSSGTRTSSRVISSSGSTSSVRTSGRTSTSRSSVSGTRTGNVRSSGTSGTRTSGSSSSTRSSSGRTYNNSSSNRSGSVNSGNRSTSGVRSSSSSGSTRSSSSSTRTYSPSSSSTRSSSYSGSRSSGSSYRSSSSGAGRSSGRTSGGARTSGGRGR